jgi:hypothetical protein
VTTAVELAERGHQLAAWVNFDGVATSNQINASYNVSSITDLTGSEYLVNFTNDMPDEHYCSLVTVGHSTTSPAMFGVPYPKASQSVSSFKFETWYYAGYNADSDNVSVAIFR